MHPENNLSNEAINKNYDKLMEYAKKICEIQKDDNIKKEEDILKNLKKYYENTHNKNSLKTMTGRVWILTKESKPHKNVIQVAQALDRGYNYRNGFWHELKGHIIEMLENGKGGAYKDLYNALDKGEKLVFYEVDIDAYLIEYAMSDLKDIVFRAAKEYFAEALIAYSTGASKWGFYNSGMDMRAYSLISSYINTENLCIEENSVNT